MSEGIIQNYLPADLTPQRIYQGQPSTPDAASTKVTIASAINNGALMVQWTSYGAVPS